MKSSALVKSTLGEICGLVTDGTHDTPRPQSVGFPLIKAKEIVGGLIDFEICDFISEKEHQRVIARSKPEKGDTLFAHIGASLGEAAYVNTTREFSIKNVALFKPNPTIIFGRYLYYLVISPQFQALAKNTRTGSAQPFLSLGLLRTHHVQFHKNINEQKKIASILSAYDDLIEDNTRRIKILEEMAQSIYREWFVNFRFPGHEKVKMVDSPMGKIPEGWRVTELSQVSRVVDCLHSKKPSEAPTPAEQYGVLLHIWNIPGVGRLDLSKKFFINEKDYRIWTKNIEVMEGDCVITNVGRVGDFAQIPRGVKAAIGRNMTAVRPIPEGVSPTFLIEYLRSPFMDKERAAKVDRGTIMDSLNVKGIVKLLIPMPPKELMGQFENIAYPLRLQAQFLQEKIGNLRQTRDLLLPKLISGELDVSNLDIKTDEIGNG